MRVLFASSEIYPYAKSGGLADVADALPDALKNLVNISRVMPLYNLLYSKKMELFDTIKINFGENSYQVDILSSVKNGITNYFIKTPLLSDTKNLYSENGHDYHNNDVRFALFSMAIVKLSEKLGVDIIHLNDWHTALVALYIKDLNINIRTVFTIHNLAYQGLFDTNSLSNIKLDLKYFNSNMLEFYNKVNFLKAGIVFSDAITTVSPTYAKEILTKEFGCGLDGLLTYHKNKLSGILNGINTTLYNPKNDKALEFNYDLNNLKEKYKNKVNFIKKSTLKDPRKPLFIMISRLVEQKGIELLLESLEEIVSKRINIFLLGDGNKDICAKLNTISKKYDNFEFHEGFDDSLSRQTYASADFLLMPSIFEPCGLNQFIAMQYATIPIVHKVGGLNDSVYEDMEKCGRGIVYKNQTKSDFIKAIDRAIVVKKNSKQFNKLREANMRCNFSFESSALKYLEIYNKLNKNR